MRPVLDIQNISYSYGAMAALREVSLGVWPGKVTMLLGPNGAGKTTLFTLIARLLPLTSGVITVGETSLADAPASILSDIGIVFQQPTLDLDLTVKQNLSYFAALHALPKAEAGEQLVASLERFELSGKADDKVRSLNGGHRRRVELARAVLNRPKLLLLDEPTVGLDIPARRSFVDLVHALAAESRTAVLWATHLSDEVREGDDVAILSAGRIVAAGSLPEILKSAKVGTLDQAFGRLTSVEGAA
jgi:ABC-2 type transport system ATP-binding protein